MVRAGEIREEEPAAAAMLEEGLASSHLTGRPAAGMSKNQKKKLAKQQRSVHSEHGWPLSVSCIALAEALPDRAPALLRHVGAFCLCSCCARGRPCAASAAAAAVSQHFLSGLRQAEDSEQRALEPSRGPPPGQEAWLPPADMRRASQSSRLFRYLVHVDCNTWQSSFLQSLAVICRPSTVDRAPGEGQESGFATAVTSRPVAWYLQG